MAAARRVRTECELGAVQATHIWRQELAILILLLAILLVIVAIPLSQPCNLLLLLPAVEAFGVLAVDS
eukprot:3223431-Pleurochrysis_carterae.AAC.1